MTRAHDFFAKYVAPAVAEWRARPADARRAMAAAVALNQLADHYFHSHAGGDERFHGAKSVGELRDKLAERCAHFALLRDVAEAHKHVVLSRKSRQVTNADQTRLRGPWAEGAWAPGVWASGVWGETLVVTLDDGREENLTAIVEAVVRMWCELVGAPLP